MCYHSVYSVSIFRHPSRGIMAGVGDKWDVEKLDESNWSTWKFQMKHLLMAKEVWGHVDGTVVQPENDPAAQASFAKCKQKAMATLVMGISSSLIYLITSCDNPKDIWDTLRAQFERNTLANKLFLKRQYFTTKMKENQSLDAHLRNMKELTDKLATLGSAVEEEEQVVALLISLPPSYETLVTALEAKDDLSLTFLHQSLINEEQKRRASRGGVASRGIDRDAALNVDKVKSQPFKGKCFKCHRQGHKSSQCRDNKPANKHRPSKNYHSAKTVDDIDAEAPSSDLFVLSADQGNDMNSMESYLDFRFRSI